MSNNPLCDKDKMLTNIQFKSDYDESSLPKDMTWDYFLSRTALSKLTGLSITKQEIHKHLYLEQNPKLKVSLTHTKGAAAAIVTSNPDIASVGIDLENINRIVKAGHKKFFVNKLDEFHSLLHLWTQKEAAFKAISPLIGSTISYNKVFVLTDIWVQKNRFGLKGQSQALGQLEMLNQNAYIMYTAKVLKQ